MGCDGGSERIRTSEDLAALLVFKTSALNHYATLPNNKIVAFMRAKFNSTVANYSLSSRTVSLRCGILSY